MSLELLAVQGMTLVPSDDSLTVTWTIPPVPGQPSTKVLPEGKGVYKDTLSVVAASVSTEDGYSGTGTDPGVFTATSEKNKADGLFVLREKDESSTISAVVFLGQSSKTVNFEAVIDDAGQTKVLGE